MDLPQYIDLDSYSSSPGFWDIRTIFLIFLKPESMPCAIVSLKKWQRILEM